jgi:Holliday junction resolvasome RuvABC endonuclease subunit
MRVLGIDPAARSGWAVASIKDRIDASGVWSLGTDATNRPHRLAEYIRFAVRKYAVTVIAYEVATFGGRHMHVMRRMNNLEGVIQAVSGELGVECWAFGISSWKARAVGAGNADKAGVMRGLRNYYGIEVTDDNQADAIGIAFAAQQGPPPESKKSVKRAERKKIKALPRLFR